MLSPAAKLVADGLRAGRDAPLVPLAERRASEAKGLALLPMADGVRIRSIDVVGDSILAEPELEHAPAAGMILYLHGGAYVTGTGRSRASVTSHLAAATGVKVLSLDYRLAPEHPYPAAVEDAGIGLARCGELSDGGPVAVVGDSAGGGLTMATLVRAAPGAVRCAVLFSPWADLTLSSGAVAGNAGSDVMLRRDRLAGSAADYAGPVPLDDPGVSPRFADLSGLPPLLIFAAGPELLVDDALALAAGAALARDLPRLARRHRGGARGRRGGGGGGALHQRAVRLAVRISEPGCGPGWGCPRGRRPG
jgi:epsilon-lactone hydrolase